MTGCTSGGYDQFEKSPKAIEQELRPAVCERRQTDLRQIIETRQVTRATHVRNRVCPRVELILKIIIILLIIFLGFIKSKPTLLLIANNKSEKNHCPCLGFELVYLHSATADVIINSQTPYPYATQLAGLCGFQFSCISGRIADRSKHAGDYGLVFFSRIIKL